MGTRNSGEGMGMGMLPSPPSRENGGCTQCSEKGLLAYRAGCTIVIIEMRSMQLVNVLLMPLPSSSSLLHRASSTGPGVSPGSDCRLGRRIQASHRLDEFQVREEEVGHEVHGHGKLAFDGNSRAIALGHLEHAECSLHLEI